MRRLIASGLVLLSATACTPKEPPTISPQQRAVQRIGEADALVRAGCFDCLVEALAKYEDARTVPATAQSATAGAVRAAILLAIRERELGFSDSGYLTRARELAASLPAIQASMSLFVEVATTITPQAGGQRGSQVTNDAQLSAVAAAYRNSDAWAEQLAARANEEPFTAYMYLAFSCAYRVPTRENIASWMAQVQAWPDVPLVRFKRGTCGSYDGDRLEALLTADSRFVEINYYVGLRGILEGKLDTALDSLQRAYAWHEQWPGISQSIAGVYVTAEDFEQALAFYNRTLALVEDHPEALLGKVKALTYLTRNAEAISTVDQLLALERWYVGDARYWRALNEVQMTRNDDAWADIELAAKLLVNAQVPKLAGIISFRLKQLETARQKFDESKTRNPADCETVFYLGVVQGELGRWTEVTATLTEAGACLQSSNQQMLDEIVKLRAPDDQPPERKARQMAKREQTIAQQERMLAQSWFNTAVAYYNLQQKAEAQQFAEKVASDQQFGERARGILNRVRPSPLATSP